MTETDAMLSLGLWDRILAEQDRNAWIADEQAYSYADLAETICGMTAAMNSLGWAPDHRLLIASRNDWIAYTTWLSALLNGITPIMIAPDVGVERLRAICDAANVRAVIADEGRFEGLGTALSQVELVQADRLVEEARGTTANPSLCLPPSGIAYVLFTSGTTSASKGVVISHDNLAAQLSTIRRVFKVDRGSRVFNGLVLFHVDGLIQGPLLCTSAGATLIRPKSFLPTRIEDDMTWLAEMRATHMVGAPALFDLILQGARRDDYFDRPEFVALLSSSAKIPNQLWDELEERFSVRLINEYGMTETVAATHFAGSFPEMGGRHSIGWPIDCEARAVDSTGRQTPVGEIGELQVRGPNIFSGYLNDPEGTAEVLVDGWFRTGDLVKAASSGDYEIVGRIKTAMNFGGFLIQPEEIDEAILCCPGVREAVTVGIDDAVFGQVAVSAYVAEHTVDPGVVLDTCREHLEARKVPRQVVQFGALPRTGSGKPDLAAVKNELLEKVADRGQQGTGLEERVLAIAAGVFGVPREALSLQSAPDTTTGWDSFSHTALAIEVEASFGTPLSASVVMEIGSLADLVAAVSRAMSADDRRALKRLQTIRDGKGRGSIVVLPDLGGRSEYIKHLFPVLDDSIAIHSISIDPGSVDREIQPTMHDIVEQLGIDILDEDIARPLVLLGHSFAGFLAYETAAFLREKGAQVDAVVLLDTAIPWRFRLDAPLRRVAFAAKNVRDRWRGDFPTGDNILSEPGYWRIDLSEYPQSLQNTLRAWYHAMISYCPSHSEIPILLFSAKTRRSEGEFAGRNLGWRHFTSGPIRNVWLGDDHLSLIRDPSTAGQAAREINEFITQLNSSVSSG